MSDPQSLHLTLVARRTFRIGVQSLYEVEAENRWFVSIKNRTYVSFVEIPAEKVSLWRGLLAKE